MKKEKISCMEVHTLMSINFHLFGKTSIGTLQEVTTDTPVNFIVDTSGCIVLLDCDNKGILSNLLGLGEYEFASTLVTKQSAQL